MGKCCLVTIDYLDPLALSPSLTETDEFISFFRAKNERRKAFRAARKEVLTGWFLFFFAVFSLQGELVHAVQELQERSHVWRYRKMRLGIC